MASQGPLYCGTAADFNDGGSVAWSNVTNAQGLQNGTLATAGLTIVQTSQRLRASNFGFSIPAGAVINGITVELYMGDSPSGNVTESSIKLLVGGTEVGTDKSTGATLGAMAWVTFGGTSDLWGLTPTVAQLNASNFGVSAKFNNFSGGATATVRVDAVRITVTYTAVVNGNASGSIGTLTLSSPTSSATGTASAAGDPGTLTMSAPNASGVGDGSGGGAFGELLLTPPTSSAQGDAGAAGALDVLALASPNATATGDGSVLGSLPTVVLVAPAGSASGVTTKGGSVVVGSAANSTTTGYAARGAAGRIPRRQP